MRYFYLLCILFAHLSYVQASTPSFTATDSIRFFYDGDGDGLGDIDSMIIACEAPMGFVIDATDCDDSDPTNANCVTYIVNTTDDNDDGVCDDKHCSLREAINISINNKFRSLLLFSTNSKIIELENSLVIGGDEIIINGQNLDIGGKIILQPSFSFNNLHGLFVGTTNSVIKNITLHKFPVGLNSFLSKNTIYDKLSLIGNTRGINTNNDSSITISNSEFMMNSVPIDNYFSKNVLIKNNNFFSNNIAESQNSLGIINVFRDSNFFHSTLISENSGKNNSNTRKFFTVNNYYPLNEQETILLKSPIIISDSMSNSHISIAGNALAGTQVEIYKSTDSKNFRGEPEIYLGSVKTDSKGNWTFNLSDFDTLNPLNRYLAISVDWDSFISSEFSDSYQLKSLTCDSIKEYNVPEELTLLISDEIYINLEQLSLPQKGKWFIIEQADFLPKISIISNTNGVYVQGKQTGKATLLYEFLNNQNCIERAIINLNVIIDCISNTIQDSIFITNKNSEGLGSIQYAIDCTNRNDHLKVVKFKLSDSLNEIFIKKQIDVNKSIVIDGVEDGSIHISGDSLILKDDYLMFLNSPCEVKGIHFKNAIIGLAIGPNELPSIIGNNLKPNYFTNLREALGILSGAEVNYNNFNSNYTSININGLFNSKTWRVNIKKNKIINSQIGIKTSSILNDTITIIQNEFICNDNSILLKNNNTENIGIRSVDDKISGYSEPFSMIEIYLSDTICDNCQGTKFLNNAVADKSGLWSVELPIGLEPLKRITILSTDTTGNTSSFSKCHIILPNVCQLSALVPINLDPCSQIGSVMDMTQLSDSGGDIFSEGCADTYAGNDVWYTVTIPPTGHALVRTNTENTISPVIQVYEGDCDGLVPIECQILDSLPYSLILEDYTPGNTIYLRAWDKNNEIVDSDGTALLHLTAHELSSNKEDWVICDQKSNLLNNPTILSRKDANTFIIEYDSTATADQIARTARELLAEGLTLEDECLCNEAPLQLWGASNPIEMEGLKRRSSVRTRVDTTNYNYIFENIEFQVNSYAIGQQYETDVSMDAAGNFVMVWVDEQRRHNYGRYYSSSGNPLVPEFRIGARDQEQDDTRVLMLDESRFIAVWRQKERGQFSIWARPFEWTGAEIISGEIVQISENALLSSFISTEQKSFARRGSHFDIGWDGDETIGIVWSAGGELYYQSYSLDLAPLYDAREIGEDIRSDVLPYPALDMNAQGDIIICWTGADRDGDGIYCQAIHEYGLPATAASRVNTQETNAQDRAHVNLFTDGSYVVTWQSENQHGTESGFDIYAKRYTADHKPIGEEQLVNQYILDDQKTPSVTTFDNGSYYISWSSYGQDGYEEGIFGRVYDADGQPVDDEFQVNVFTDPEQEKPRTANNGENLFITAWEDGGNDGSYKGIFAQRYEILDRGGFKTYYPIGTATPSTLLGDFIPYPDQFYVPQTQDNVVRVAIIDSGIDLDHPAIREGLWNNQESAVCLAGDEIGYDFVNDLGDPIDLDGHGTQVTGIIARDFDPNVRLELMNLKFYEKGRATVFDAICAIYYAVDHGANIINLSWGFEASEEPAILRKALEYAAERDVLVVTTAGNTSKNLDRINKYPANLDIPNMITVTSYLYNEESDEKKLANYACYGAENVDIAAVGYVEAPSLGDTIVQTAGTSLAAPFVTRTAATMKGMYPQMTAADIYDCIISTAQPADALADRIKTGGSLDHEEAMECAFQKFMTTSVDDLTEYDLTVNIYPNPTNTGQFSIDSKETIKRVMIYDVQGKLMIDTDELSAINISDHTDGIYFVRMLLDSNRWLTKELVLTR